MARAGASAAIGMGYSRRNVPWLSLTVVAAVALCGRAVLIRSGSHAVWLTAVSAEAGLVVVGLIRFAYTRYMGGSLPAILTLGMLAHPGVAGAFARVRQRVPIDDEPAAADGTCGPAAGRHVRGEFPDARQGGGLPAGGAIATLLSQGIPPEGAA
jgi:hypothetical protein